MDTNAFIWHLTNNPKLSPDAQVIFAYTLQGKTQLVVPSIVVAEIYYADKKWHLFQDFQATYLGLKQRQDIQFVDFTPDEVLDFEANNAVSEMHDRIVVGVAKKLGVPLITSDQNIRDSGLVRVVW